MYVIHLIDSLCVSVFAVLHLFFLFSLNKSVLMLHLECLRPLG